MRGVGGPGRLGDGSGPACRPPGFGGVGGSRRLRAGPRPAHGDVAGPGAVLPRPGRHRRRTARSWRRRPLDRRQGGIGVVGTAGLPQPVGRALRSAGPGVTGLASPPRFPVGRERRVRRVLRLVRDGGTARGRDHPVVPTARGGLTADRGASGPAGGLVVAGRTPTPTRDLDVVGCGASAAGGGIVGRLHPDAGRRGRRAGHGWGVSGARYRRSVAGAGHRRSVARAGHRRSVARAGYRRHVFLGGAASAGRPTGASTPVGPVAVRHRRGCRRHGSGAVRRDGHAGTDGAPPHPAGPGVTCVGRGPAQLTGRRTGWRLGGTGVRDTDPGGAHGTAGPPGGTRWRRTARHRRPSVGAVPGHRPGRVRRVRRAGVRGHRRTRTRSGRRAGVGARGRAGRRPDGGAGRRTGLRPGPRVGLRSRREAGLGMRWEAGLRMRRGNRLRAGRRAGRRSRLRARRGAGGRTRRRTGLRTRRCARNGARPSVRAVRAGLRTTGRRGSTDGLVRGDGPGGGGSGRPGWFRRTGPGSVHRARARRLGLAAAYRGRGGRTGAAVGRRPGRAGSRRVTRTRAGRRGGIQPVRPQLGALLLGRAQVVDPAELLAADGLLGLGLGLAPPPAATLGAGVAPLFGAVLRSLRTTRFHY
ncbi:hypothetical protein DER29_0093 [Micromonospora sp. M71_S20]|nr:hypothetical protein DER29_0093 [Micromonospora sp. M71_S20]